MKFIIFAVQIYYIKMKVLSYCLMLTCLLMIAGCKTQKIPPKPEPVKTEIVPKNTTTTASNTKVTSKSEAVTAVKGEGNGLGSKKFYVILGSYSVYENAQKFKKQLMAEDFFPGILVNNEGMYRISVNSYDDEALARARISEIREKFPKYSDVWLLIKK